MASQLYSDSHQQKALRKINHTKVYTYIDDAPNWLLFFVWPQFHYLSCAKRTKLHK